MTGVANAFADIRNVGMCEIVRRGFDSSEKSLEDLGYTVFAEVYEALDYGSPIPRSRMWWCVLRDTSTANAAVMRQHFDRALIPFRRAKPIIPVDNMLVEDTLQRQQISKLLQIPTIFDSGIRGGSREDIPTRCVDLGLRLL